MLETLGSDMEVFGKTKDGHHVALCGLIGGTKEAPMQLPHLPNGFTLQEDNVALEFNIPPATSKKVFINNFRIMRKEVSNLLLSLGFGVSKEASVSFDTKELQHPNALVFGCEPDYSAWTQMENPRPEAQDETLRTCGGHIHIGTRKDMVDVIKKMDLYVGVPSVILDNKASSIRRRELYGKAGAMRPKPYGVEYRTASNFWMFDDRLVGWIYDQTYFACSDNRELTQEMEQAIQECINTGNVSLAKDICNKFNINTNTKKISRKEQSREVNLELDGGRGTQPTFDPRIDPRTFDPTTFRIHIPTPPPVVQTETAFIGQNF